MHGFCVYALRATAATNALAHNADIAKVQEGLRHANIQNTTIYARLTTATLDAQARTTVARRRGMDDLSETRIRGILSEEDPS